MYYIFSHSLVVFFIYINSRMLRMSLFTHSHACTYAFNNNNDNMSFATNFHWLLPSPDRKEATEEKKMNKNVVAFLYFLVNRRSACIRFLIHFICLYIYIYIFWFLYFSSSLFVAAALLLYIFSSEPKKQQDRNERSFSYCVCTNEC